jgi:quinol monooxygenase YgiN
MVTIIASVVVKEGKMEEAMSVLKELVPKIKNSESGLLDYVPHTVKGKENKNLIIFYERYADDAALKLHMANLGKNLAKFIPLLEPGMEMKTCYEIIDH